MDEEKIVIDNQTGQVINNAKPAKTSKQHPVLYLVLVAIISLSCGLAGGYVAARYTTPQTVIYKSDSQNVNPSFATDGSIQSVIASVKDSVVEINTETIETNDFYSFFGISGNNLVEGAGSGVIISKDGYIVTNNHVIDSANTIKVRLTNGEVYDAALIATDSKSDVAVIKIDAKDLTCATVGNSDNLLVGDSVIAIGNPLGSLGGTATDGIISSLNREVTVNNEKMNLIQTNAAINSGNSGGGLFNAAGELVGIVNAKSVGTSVEGLGFAIPINDVMKVVDQLIENGYVTDRATLGVKVTELAQDTKGYKAGLYIQSTIDGSGAQKAGLKPYDRIIAINDTEISSYTDLSSQLQNYNVGDIVKITIVRDGQQMDVDVTLTGPIQE